MEHELYEALKSLLNVVYELDPRQGPAYPHWLRAKALVTEYEQKAAVHRRLSRITNQLISHRDKEVRELALWADSVLCRQIP